MKYTKPEDSITEHLLDMLLLASRGQHHITDAFDVYQQDLRNLGQQGLANAFAVIKDHVVEMKPVNEKHHKQSRFDDMTIDEAARLINAELLNDKKRAAISNNEPQDTMQCIEKDIASLVDHINRLKDIDPIYKTVCDRGLDYVEEAKRVLPY